MSWQWARERMTETLHLNLPPQVDYFEKSPACTPTKVLKTLDLLSVDGLFVPKNDHPSSCEFSSALSSMVATPILNRKHHNEIMRRRSFTPGVIYDHTISDEFAYINLTIKERRQSWSSDDIPTKKHLIYTTSNNAETNKIVIAKVFDDGNGDGDEIEIIDLDDDKEYYSSFKHQPRAAEKCYPNCDVNVWLRSCEHEIVEPIEGTLSGQIPKWINGSLLRNGPGSIKVGEMTYNHLFDSAALLHRFNIVDGQVTYQCRFLKSDSYKKNLAANRIVVSEFGTVSVPDPCQSIFQRYDFEFFFRNFLNFFFLFIESHHSSSQQIQIPTTQ
jgi:carotenoid isomerooxygenase